MKKLSGVARQTPLSAADFLDAFRVRTSADWSRAERRHLLSLFKRMALGVPAYRRFLREEWMYQIAR